LSVDVAGTQGSHRPGEVDADAPHVVLAGEPRGDEHPHDDVGQPEFSGPIATRARP
jgi:hypothetical protein